MRELVHLHVFLSAANPWTGVDLSALYVFLYEKGAGPRHKREARTVHFEASSSSPPGDHVFGGFALIHD